MIDRLAEDHTLAHQIGEALMGVSGLQVKHEGLRTNIMLVDIDPAWGNAEKLVSAMKTIIEG